MQTLENEQCVRLRNSSVCAACAGFCMRGGGTFLTWPP